MKTHMFPGTDGVRLAGWEIGAGPTVVLLHAGGERSSVWVPIAEKLADRHALRCVAIDQRGHGASGGAAERLSDFGSDLGQVLAAQPGPCAIVGASLGGFAAIAALETAAARAKTVGIVLVDVVPDPEPLRVHRFLAEIGMDVSHRPLIDDILAAGSDLLALVASFNPPLHLVLASDSAISRCDIERLRAAAIQFGTTRVDSGHLVARDAPDRLAEIIARIATDWLAGVRT